MDKILEEKLILAKYTCRDMMRIRSEVKNQALMSISLALLAHKSEIIEANQMDIQEARRNHMNEVMIDRLMLNDERIESMARDVKMLTTLEDPIGQIIRTIERPNGLLIQQVRVPMGVFGIIYESRPNVTVDIACLCIKSGNVCILKGGKEAIHSNQVLTSLMQNAVSSLLPKGAIHFIDNTDRDMVNQLIKANQYVDVVVPRGGKSLIDFVVQHATVPVIETGAGNCHLYIDEYANMKKALDISVNVKIQRPSVCNAVETILVHKNIAGEYLPLMVKAFDERVEIRGDEMVREIIDCFEANEDDYAKEYDDYIVAIKIVDSIQDAVKHIYDYSTKHSESIVTENQDNALEFMNALDSACVYHNASTRFSDGGEFGFGAELGISTQKLHARGPLGLIEMTSYQYRIYGQGQVRE